MTVKEIFEKTEFGKSIEVAGIRDYKISYLGSFEYYLDMYKKAFRKNAAFRYRQIKALLDIEAVVITYTLDGWIDYDIITRRSFEGSFSTPLKDHEKIIFE